MTALTIPAETPNGGAVAMIASASPRVTPPEPPIDATNAGRPPAARDLPLGAPAAVPLAESTPARPELIVPDLSGFHELRIWAETYADQQDHRKRIMNRLGLKADGTPTASGAAIPVELFAGQLDAIQTAEHLTALAMRRCYRRVAPTGILEWQRDTFGIGEHLLARLLGALGHPRIATPYHWQGDGTDRELIADPPFERTVRQLWSYCGHGDAARKKAKGMTADDAFALGSPRCKMLVHLLAEAAIKCRLEPERCSVANEGAAEPTTSPESPILCAVAMVSPAARDLPPRAPSGGACAKTSPAPADTLAEHPECLPRAIRRPGARRLRAIYEQRRAVTATTRPEWTDGHSHADALRIVGKALLAELWEVSQ